MEKIIPTAVMLLVRNYFNTNANDSYLVSLGEDVVVVVVVFRHVTDLRA